MKIFKCLFLLSVVIFTYSCKKETNQITAEKQSVSKVAELKKSEFHISGMTCQMGCAKLIESKLSKTAGIESVKVSFKDSIGYVTYDKNQLDTKEISQIIDNIGGGDLYSVSKVIAINDLNSK